MIMPAINSLQVLQSNKTTEVKDYLKFSFMMTSIAATSMIGIYSGYIGSSAVAEAHRIETKICSFFVIAAFIPGAMLMLLAYKYHRFKVPIEIMKTLKYTSLVCLVVALVYIGIVFMKALVFAAIVVSFLPTLVVVLVLVAVSLNEKDNETGPNQFDRNTDQDGTYSLQMAPDTTGTESTVHEQVVEDHNAIDVVDEEKHDHQFLKIEN